jgi:hypothetical protein
MFLFVPTRGRTTIAQQETLASLPDFWRKRTTIVCPSNEVDWFIKNYRGIRAVWKQPNDKMTIAAKRAWIFQRTAKEKMQKIMMLDDDLRFGIRLETPKQFKGYGVRPYDAWKEYRAKHSDAHKLILTDKGNDLRAEKIFYAIERMLSTYAHGGIAPRLMNQEYGHEFCVNGRVNYALAYHVPTVMEHCELGRINTREDFDYTLQLMRAGFPNAVYCWGICEQYKLYGAPGGTTGQRTVENSNADAKKLAKLHPGIVKVVEKDYKGAGKRLEVVVSWANAIAEGKCEFV